ncbi:MAG: hypothetical protein ACOH18_05025 [Candidatus Saccharimonadaceae bacterium]
MSGPSTHLSNSPAKKKAAAWIDAKLERLATVRALKVAEKQRSNELHALVDKQSKQILEGFDSEINDIVAEVVAFYRHRLGYMLRWFTKTSNRPAGDIMIVNYTSKLVLPGDTGPVIDALEKLPDGKLYVRIIKQVDKKALGEAPESIIRKLRPLGVRRGPFDAMQLKTPSDEHATTVDEWRAPVRTRRSTPKQP